MMRTPDVLAQGIAFLTIKRMNRDFDAALVHPRSMAQDAGSGAQALVTTIATRTHALPRRGW